MPRIRAILHRFRPDDFAPDPLPHGAHCATNQLEDPSLLHKPSVPAGIRSWLQWLLLRVMAWCPSPQAALCLCALNRQQHCSAHCSILHDIWQAALDLQPRTTSHQQTSAGCAAGLLEYLANETPTSADAARDPGPDRYEPPEEGVLLQRGLIEPVSLEARSCSRPLHGMSGKEKNSHTLPFEMIYSPCNLVFPSIFRIRKAEFHDRSPKSSSKRTLQE